MTDFTQCQIASMSIHHVGNATQEEALRLSDSPADLSDPRLNELLARYFLDAFRSEERYTFTFSNGDHRLNPLFRFAETLFDAPDQLHAISIDIARQLYEVAVHPQIKPGDLFVVYFSQLSLQGETTEAIGIFKSESRHPFLKLDQLATEFSLRYDEGINVEKLDKGCLILNLDREEGYRVCVVDKANRSAEAQYWKDLFLQISPARDAYHQTRDFLSFAKSFVKEQLPEEFEVSKADQIDLLNRSVAYFKTHDTFDKKEFEEEVFVQEDLIRSFRDFDGSYRENNQTGFTDEFEISTQAVKKQAKIFKSVLKLDKNFHIYIHGDRDLIEQGVDEGGRKFYKIYYQDER